MTKTLLGLVTAAALGVAAGAASAATLGTIDFTAASTGLSGSVGGVSWVMTGSPVAPNNTQAYDGGLPKPTSAFGLAFTRDGYGVTDDELTSPPPETITVTFGSVVEVLGFAFLDLFQSATAGLGEFGILTTGGSDTTLAYSTNANFVQSGYAEATGLSLFGTVFTFSVGTTNDRSGAADGALAALQIAAVPLPAGMLLLATALGGFGVARRMRKSV